MKKIGLICLALVMSLGVFGVAYASWNDTITINGSVETGTLDLSVDGFSGTWVYKIVSTGACVIQDHEEDPIPAGWIYVASAVAEQGPGGTHDVLVTFDNLFPCIDFVADFTVHYHGTIPANLKVSPLTVTGIPPAWVTMTGTWPTDGQQVDADTDWHAAITIHVPQPPNGKDGQGILDGTISGSIYAQQWNEPMP